jgi:hypothetical protein
MTTDSSADAVCCFTAQASVAKNAAGQTQVKLSNNQDYPAVCNFQVRLLVRVHTHR